MVDLAQLDQWLAEDDALLELIGAPPQPRSALFVDANGELRRATLSEVVKASPEATAMMSLKVHEIDVVAHGLYGCEITPDPRPRPLAEVEGNRQVLSSHGVRTSAIEVASALVTQSNFFTLISQPSFAASFRERFRVHSVSIALDEATVHYDDEEELELFFAWSYSTSDSPETIVERESNSQARPTRRGQPRKINRQLLTVNLPNRQSATEHKIKFVLDAFDEDGEAHRTAVQKYVSEVSERVSGAVSLKLPKSDLARLGPAITPWLPLVDWAVDFALAIWRAVTFTEDIATLSLEFSSDQASIYQPRGGSGGKAFDCALLSVGGGEVTQTIQGGVNLESLMARMSQNATLRHYVVATVEDRIEVVLTVDVHYFEERRANPFSTVAQPVQQD